MKGEKEFLGRCHGLAGLPGGEERVLGKLSGGKGVVEWKKFLRSFQGKWECVKGEKEFLRCHGLAGLPGGEERVLGRLEWIKEFLFPGGRFVAWERVLLQGCEKGDQ